MPLKEKLKLGVASGVATVVTVAGTCFADEAVNTAMSTALTGVKTDATGAISTVAPIGIGIMGLFLVWKYGLRFFKAISK